MGKKLSLREVFKHSKSVDYIEVEGLFQLEIRPWTVVQLEDLQQIVFKIYQEMKKREKGVPAMEAFLDVIGKKEFLADVMYIVYAPIERSNEKRSEEHT